MSNNSRKCPITVHTMGKANPPFTMNEIGNGKLESRFNIDIFDCRNLGKERIYFSPDAKNRTYEKVILLFDCPLQVGELQKCRDLVIKRKATEIQVITDTDNFREKVKQFVNGWCQTAETEEYKLKRGTFVSITDPAETDPAKDDPMHLYASAMIGKMGHLLMRLQQIAIQYVKEIKKINDENTLKKRIDDITKAVQGGNGSENDENTPRLPKVLLLGDSGVGKSLVANFLHKCVLDLLKDEKIKLVETLHPARIAIPEFLGKIDDFEYRLFGYTSGAFTDAKENGDIGLLAQNMGQVIFLDEMGTADSAIQAKLLAYLDDYKIRPRGWKQSPFLCPTLVVAATNEKKKLENKDEFRNDLLARFSDVLEIPNLKERIAGGEKNFNYILDCVLQEDDISQYGIVEIGAGAWKILWDHFSNGCNGNFRELETWIRDACKNANADHRTQLIAQDFDSKK